MEIKFEALLRRWPDQVRIVPSKKLILILSVDGLGSHAKELLKTEVLEILQRDKSTSSLLSVILSIKQGHIYFRLGQKTYDYRPHRGAFSKVAVSDYRLGNTDRSEILMALSEFEMQQFFRYVSNIENNRSQVLGEAHPISLFEPDFTVKSFETKGKLHENPFLDEKSVHNCLTWITTAPLGRNGENLIQLLGMGPKDIENEAHSYIVQFYRFLLEVVNLERVPAVLFWTTEKAEQVQYRIESSSDYLLNFYSPDSQKKSTLFSSRLA